MKVSWDKAESDLQGMDSAVVDQLKENAEMVLHRIPPAYYPADEGADGAVMWHRAYPHGRPAGQDGGPHEYFLLYTQTDSEQEFEILGVRNIHQIASRCAWMDSWEHGESPPL